MYGTMSEFQPYTTGGGGSVGHRQNQNYEAVVYEDEDVYVLPK